MGGSVDTGGGMYTICVVFEVIYSVFGDVEDENQATNRILANLSYAFLEFLPHFDDLLERSISVRVDQSQLQNVHVRERRLDVEIRFIVDASFQPRRSPSLQPRSVARSLSRRAIILRGSPYR